MINDQKNEERLVQLEARIKKIEDSLSLSPSRLPIEKDKKLSPKEFLITKKLTSDLQKTLALGYYLECIEGMKSFNVADLMRIFRSAKEKLPTNINDAVNKNIKQGFLMEAAEKKGDKKAWVLTSTGERHIEEKLKS